MTIVRLAWRSPAVRASRPARCAVGAVGLDPAGQSKRKESVVSEGDLSWHWLSVRKG
jgi:hypothetical protein